MEKVCNFHPSIFLSLFPASTVFCNKEMNSKNVVKSLYFHLHFCLFIVNLSKCLIFIKYHSAKFETDFKCCNRYLFLFEICFSLNIFFTQVSYFIFLGLFAYMAMLEKANNRPELVEWIVIAYVVSLTFEEIHQVSYQSYNCNFYTFQNRNIIVLAFVSPTNCNPVNSCESLKKVNLLEVPSTQPNVKVSCQTVFIYNLKICPSSVTGTHGLLHVSFRMQFMHPLTLYKRGV